MKRTEARRSFSLGLAAILIATIVVAGCSRTSHPDQQAAVYQSLSSHDLSSVMVNQNRESGVITLTGVVGGADRKSRAEELAKAAAPGYTITDNIQVVSSGLQGMITAATAKSELDASIENHFKASIEEHKDLDLRAIQFWANGGTLTLKGIVKTEKERREAEELAQKVPQVQHVVNYIQVAPHKTSTSNS
jgi:hyperosmotically inducible periplasmic protein